MGKFIDLVGKRFARLTVQQINSRKGKEGVKWECLCDCGKTTFVVSKHLNSGLTKSCGCLQHDAVMKHNLSHGMTHTRQYTSWRHMKERCNNPSNKDYKYYGGRGIKVCDKWNDFEGFWEDMKEGYSNNLTIDRIDYNGNYEKSNCRWATQQQQVDNTRQNNIKTVDGITDTLTNLCKRYNVTPTMVKYRIKKGFTVDQAFKIPKVINGQRLI